MNIAKQTCRYRKINVARMLMVHLNQLKLHFKTFVAYKIIRETIVAIEFITREQHIFQQKNSMS